MSVSRAEEIQLFERFIERAEANLAQANLPEWFTQRAKGTLVAGPDLIGPLEDYSDSYESWGWERSPDGGAFRRFSRIPYGELNITQGGNLWYVYRHMDLDCTGQALVVAEDVPVCTRTFRDALRLAEHCNPVVREPMAGYWRGIW
jgi:hypothetical protein